MKNRAKPSKDIFDHLILGLKLKRTPLDIRRAFRRWAFSRYLPSHQRFELTDEERDIVVAHPAFTVYIHDELNEQFADNSLRDIVMSLVWQKEEQEGEPTGFDLPQILKLSPVELAANRERYERTRPNIDNLYTEKTIHSRVKTATDVRMLPPSNEDEL